MIGTATNIEDYPSMPGDSEESFVDVLILEDNTWPSSQSESELSE